MSKKKITDPDGAMEELIKKAVDLAQAPFTPERNTSLPSLRSVATELGTTVIRARKLLITADYFTSPTASAVQKMMAEGKSVDEICASLHLKPSAVYGYLPYEVRPYNLPETTANADRHKRYRATKKLQSHLQENGGVFDSHTSFLLWRCMVIYQNYPFQTSGRNGKGAVEFTYTVSAEGKSGGRHYEGESVDGWGNEIWVGIGGVKKEKSISRSSVDLAFQKYLEKDITGPKQLGVFGASYLLPLFQRFYPGG